MNTIVAALAALALAVPARAQDSGVALPKDEPDYVKRLPFKPKLFEPVDTEDAEQHMRAAQEHGDAAPNYFKVGEEMLMLPEVFSKLDDQAIKQDFPHEGNAGEEEASRKSRWWGRLYIDGWPQTVQYMRAHFGEPPPSGMRPMVLADPIDACAAVLNNAEEIKKYGAIVVAQRGTCTFGTKGKNVLASGGSALVIVNNEPGNMHAPGPDAHDLKLSVSMVAEDEGNLLVRSMAKGMALMAAMVPIHCSTQSETVKTMDLCRGSTEADRAITNSIIEGGWVKGLPDDAKHEYLQATFGTKISTAKKYELINAVPANACDAESDVLDNAEDVAGKAVIIQRGGCQFLEKVMKAWASNATLVIIANTETSVNRYGCEPRWKGLKVDIPALMVTDKGGEVMMQMQGQVVEFAASPKVRKSTWEKMDSYRDTTGWAKKKPEQKMQLKTLRTEHAEWPDRIAAINMGYGLKTDGPVPPHGEEL